MKKIFYIIGIAALFLIASCNNEDIGSLEPEVKGYTPILQGTFGQFTGNNPEGGTRAGVIEDGFDPEVGGEQFYWHDGDRVRVLFFKDGNLGSDPIQLVYRADVPNGRPKTADFTIVEGEGDETVPAGEYTVYSLYPADGWTQNDDDKWSVEIEGYRTSGIFIPMTDETSRYAGEHMYMKAKVEDVSIEEGGTNAVDLSFAHLTSIIRIRIADSDNPALARLYRLSMGVSNVVHDNPTGNQGFESVFNPIAGYLESLDDDSFVITDRLNAARVQIPGDLLNDLDVSGFDLFIPMLPTELAGKRFTFSPRFYNETGTTETWAKYITVDRNDVEGIISFKAGRSYFFNLGTPTPQ